jgi:Protein of unknown function (DUF1360)
VSVETRPRPADGPFSGYADPSEQPPLGSYAALTALFNAAFAGALAAARASDRELPERIGAGDVVLLGTASHKLSRMMSKDRVTSFARAPFAEYQEPGGPGEVEESPRGRGLRRAIGELLVCPYCLGMWTSAGLHVGLIFAPRTTRLLASTFTALTISDFLQIAYKAAEDRGLGGS